MILTREQIDALAPWQVDNWKPSEVDDLIDTARAYHDLRDAVLAEHAEHDCNCLGGVCSDCPNRRFCNSCGTPAPCATVQVAARVERGE